MRAGAREYLTKPFDIEHLVQLVHEALATGRIEDEPVQGVSVVMRQVEATLAR